MEPEEVVKASHFKLVGFVYHNFDSGQDVKRLDLFDAYVQEELTKKGYKKGDAMLSPSLRLGFTQGIEKLDKMKEPTKPTAEPKVKKPKAEVDEKTGVRKGTKKAMTYELTNQGIAMDKIIEKVKAAFPDAEEKSIKIWHKRCLKAGNDKK
jgi:hypothetical protein